MVRWGMLAWIFTMLNAGINHKEPEYYCHGLCPQTQLWNHGAIMVNGLAALMWSCGRQENNPVNMIMNQILPVLLNNISDSYLTDINFCSILTWLYSNSITICHVDNFNRLQSIQVLHHQWQMYMVSKYYTWLWVKRFLKNCYQGAWYWSPMSTFPLFYIT